MFTPAAGANATSVTMSLANQQYTGLPYSNITTGLVFGAQPTTAFGSNTQGVDPGNTFDNLGAFSVAPGGPTDNMYTAAPSFTSGTGIVTGALFLGPEANGAVVVFTAAQPQFDAVGGPTVHNNTTRYYYGDLVINFNRYIANPVLHIAGLGGSYRYWDGTGLSSDPLNWNSTYFTTELEIVGANGTKLSGNSFLTVAGNSITNNAAAPSGASVSTAGVPGAIFDEIGAASGSVRIAKNTNSITLRIYLRGSNASDFPWSAIGTGPNQQVPGGTRNPFPGDVWSVSVSAELAQLITLPSTGLSLQGALNGNDVKLNWKTQTEINSKEFAVERSTDGVSFTEIGLQDAAGNSTTEKNYDFFDRNMAASVYYYRVRMIDNNDRYGYSNIVAIRKAGGVKDIRVYPNPATDNVSLEFTNAKGNYSIRLFNQAGQEVMSKVATVQYEVQTIGVQRNNLPAGYYMIQVRNSNDGSVRSEKVIFQ